MSSALIAIGVSPHRQSRRSSLTWDLDLREGIEKLLAFNNDRIFRFTLNGSDLQWGGAFITGATLLGLAKVDPAAHAAWLEDPDGSRRRIEASQLVDLSQPGVEAFVTEPLDGTTP